MATGTWTMAWLLLTLGAGPTDVAHINQRNFQIPIRISPERRNDIKDLVLYYSADQGNSWLKTAVAKPDQDAFPFYASADGLYWFTVVVTDQKGNQDPADIYKTQPGQKIMVDTVKPVLTIVSADRQGDEVVVRWNVQEEYPDLSTLKLEYQAADTPGGQWVAAAFNPTASGQTSFKALGGGPVSVRMQVQDLAGNVATAQTEVAAAPAPMPTQAPVPPVTPPPVPTLPATIPTPAPTMVAPPTTASITTVAPAPPAATTVTSSPPPPSAKAEQGWTPTQSTPPAPIQNTQLVSMRSQTTAPLAERREPAPPQGCTAPPVVAGVNAGSQLVASTGDPPTAVHQTPAEPAGPTHPRGQMPALELVNTNRVTLEYEVAKYGPSGVGSVELYYTRDDGRTWQPFGGQQKLNMLMPAEGKEAPASLKRSLTVELPEEGVYGFYLVVKSGAGLGKPPPQSGDLPQLRVEVDTTAPVAKLYAPEPDLSQRDSLVISWNASDRNITQNPVTLEWTERKGGSWEVIGKPEMPNTGRYTWQVPRNIPSRVFLRLTVRDTAGNVGIAETNELVLVDLNEPVVERLGLSSRSNSQK